MLIFNGLHKSTLANIYVASPSASAVYTSLLLYENQNSVAFSSAGRPMFLIRVTTAA